MDAIRSKKQIFHNFLKMPTSPTENSHQPVLELCLPGEVSG